jgi:phenylacetate-CoA ligase
MSDLVMDPRLTRLMTDAARHVALYRRLWGESGIDFDGPRNASDFERVPRLDKAALRDCPPEDRVHDGRRDRSVAKELSSGSSGEPLTVFMDRAAWLARHWAFLRALLACGYRPGQRCLLLTSRRSAKWPAIARWSYASIGEETESLVQHFHALRPQLLYGPLSTLELLAQWFTTRKERPPGLALVVSTAEQLTRRRLAVLEQGFGAPVADFYGMTEFGLVAYRPPGSPVFVPARTSLILEFLPLPGDPAVEELVITDLAERTSPLIRYDTGDIARRDTARTGCPIVEFAGRSLDCLVLPDGRLISPYRIDVALEQVTGLRAYEVVQLADFSIDVTLETAPHNAELIRSTVGHKLEAVFGSVLPLRIAAGTIRREPSGTKFRPIRSLVGRST